MDDDVFDDPESDEYESASVISTSTTGMPAYSCAARQALLTAESLAATTPSGIVTSEHLLIGLASQADSAAARVLDSCGFDPIWLEGAIGFVQGAGAGGEHTGIVERSPRVERILIHAGNDATKRMSERIETLHLLTGLLREGRGIGALILESPGVGHERLGAAISQATRNGVTDPS